MQKLNNEKKSKNRDQTNFAENVKKLKISKCKNQKSRENKKSTKNEKIIKIREKHKFHEIILRN